MNEEAPSRLPVVFRPEGHGEITVPAGGRFDEYLRRAQKIAATDNLPIKFNFNGQDYSVSPEEARAELTQENIRQSIRAANERIRIATEDYRNIVESERKVIAEEEKLGSVLYGKDFLKA